METATLSDTEADELPPIPEHIPPEPVADRWEIARALRLFHRHGEPFEVRILFDRNRTSSGYFNDIDMAADTVASYDAAQKPRGIYHVMNLIDPDLFQRSPNRITERAWNTTEDINITMRRRLLVDLDPDRDSDTNSTEAELNAAIVASEIVREFLRKWGFPEPAHAISGNGVHLFTPMETPNDEASRAACRSLLKLLASRVKDFNEPHGPQIKVDTTVYNASRIVRLSGTVARKGPHTADRPHRLARLTYIPDCLPGGSVKHG